VYGYPHTQENGKVSINLNDLYSGEEKAILLEFEVLEPLQQNVNFTCITDFWDVADKAEHANSKELEVKITNNEDLLKKSEDADVKEQIVLFRSTEMFDEALRNADKGDYKKAEEQANEAEEYLKSNKSANASTRYLQQEKNVMEYKEKVKAAPMQSQSEQKMMQKASKSANYSTKKAK
ncbi:MAG: hypothetical protein ACKVTZ_18315, partial [Bacteroidia bacterium]